MLKIDLISVQPAASLLDCWLAAVHCTSAHRSWWLPVDSPLQILLFSGSWLVSHTDRPLGSARPVAEIYSSADLCTISTLHWLGAWFWWDCSQSVSSTPSWINVDNEGAAVHIKCGHGDHSLIFMLCGAQPSSIQIQASSWWCLLLASRYELAMTVICKSLLEWSAALKWAATVVFFLRLMSDICEIKRECRVLLVWPTYCWPHFLQLMR